MPKYVFIAFKTPAALPPTVPVPVLAPAIDNVLPLKLSPISFVGIML